jgi:hypothetical protein
VIARRARGNQYSDLVLVPFGVMEASARSLSSRGDDELSRSPARVFCLVVGATLVLVGLLGFIAESAFETGNGVQGEDLIVFEVNGWHNLVHIASGAFLLALMGRHDTARIAALSFGAIYGVVTIIGLADGEDVLGLFPVNAADNVLHIVLTLAAFAAGLAPLRERTRARTERAA